MTPGAGYAADPCSTTPSHPRHGDGAGSPETRFTRSGPARNPARPKRPSQSDSASRKPASRSSSTAAAMRQRDVVTVVGGKPAPQGSKRLVRLRNGRSMMLEASSAVRPWRALVADAARAAGIQLREKDVALDIVARWARPASHYGRRGLRSVAPARPGYADVDKVARAVCDALTGIAYRDDRQVVMLRVERTWCADGEAPGATISIDDA